MVLRPWTLGDRDVWHELSTSDVVLAHIDDGNPLTEADIDDRLNHAVSWQEGPGIFACELLDDPGPPIGFVGFAPPTFLPELLPVYEVGWRFLPGHWGKGYATEATTSALTWAFEGDHFERVVACIQPANRRSIAVAERLGLTPSHRTVIPRCERWTDVYELHRDIWDGGSS